MTTSDASPTPSSQFIPCAKGLVSCDITSPEISEHYVPLYKALADLLSFGFDEGVVIEKRFESLIGRMSQLGELPDFHWVLHGDIGVVGVVMPIATHIEAARILLFEFSVPWEERFSYACRIAKITMPINRCFSLWITLTCVCPAGLCDVYIPAMHPLKWYTKDARTLRTLARVVEAWFPEITPAGHAANIAIARTGLESCREIIHLVRALPFHTTKLDSMVKSLLEPIQLATGQGKLPWVNRPRTVGPMSRPAPSTAPAPPATAAPAPPAAAAPAPPATVVPFPDRVDAKFNRERLIDLVCQEIPSLSRVGAHLLVKGGETCTGPLNLTPHRIIAAMPIVDAIIKKLLKHADHSWPTVAPEPQCSLFSVLHALYPSILARSIQESIVPGALEKMNPEARDMCLVALHNLQVPVSVACCVILQMYEVPYETRLKNAWEFFHKHAITNRITAQMISTITE